MGNDQLSPIDVELWFKRLGLIARGELRSLERSLRHAFHMVQLTPNEFRRSVVPELTRDRLKPCSANASSRRRPVVIIHYPSPPVLSWVGSPIVEARTGCQQCGSLFRGAGDNSGSAILGCCLDYFSRLPSPGWCDREAHPCLREGRYERLLPLNLH